MHKRKTFVKVYLTKDQLAAVDRIAASIYGIVVLGCPSRSEVIAKLIPVLSKEQKREIRE